MLEAAGLVETRREGRYKFHHLDTRPLEHIADRWLEPGSQGAQMRINLTSVLVDDQDKALRFYTEVLGFEKKTEVPLGEHRWLTVVSPEDPDGTELVLEPDDHPAAKPFKEALVADGIPFTSFAVDDVARRVRTAARARREVHAGASRDGPVTTAVLDDTCGNLIQIAQMA